MWDAELLAVLRCPETLQEIRLAEPGFLTEINRRISSGNLKNRGGQVITEPLEAALLRVDMKVLYPIRGNIPHLLVEEGILLQEERA